MRTTTKTITVIEFGDEELADLIGILYDVAQLHKGRTLGADAERWYGKLNE